MNSKIREAWCNEPLLMKEALWPEVQFYAKQIETIHSVRDNLETYVTAGNQLGKDFVAGFIVLWMFVCFDFVRIVTTSVADKHLIVLWDEINSYVATSRQPLLHQDGGILIVNHNFIRKTKGSPQAVEKSYILGQVSEK